MQNNIKQRLDAFDALIQKAELRFLRRLSLRISTEIDSRISRPTIKIPPHSELPSEFNYKLPKDALAYILADDWSELFSEYSDHGAEHYVYMHVYPTKAGVAFNLPDRKVKIKRPFYVGVGKGDRAYNMRRASAHSALLNNLLSKGYTKNEICWIFQDGLSERAARELESKMILYFGIDRDIRGSRTNSLSGSKSRLLNNQYEPMPSMYVRFCTYYTGRG